MTGPSPRIDPTDLQAVRAYFAAHKDTLLRQTGAHGGGVGRSQRVPGAYAIALYVVKAPPAGTPQTTPDGIPIDFVVTESFKPLGL